MSADDKLFFDNRIDDMPNLNMIFRYADSAFPSASKDARAELADLRAADIRTMEHCDECGNLLVIDADAPEDAVRYCPSCELDKTRYESQRRLEDLEAIEKKCAALRAQVALLDDYSAAIRAHEITIADQARALNEARKVLHDIDEPDWTLSEALRALKSDVVSPDETIWCEWLTKQANAIDAWLSAHSAPSDEAERQTKKETCKCIVAEKPVRPCGAKCWHFSADNKSVCQNCYNTGIQQP